MVVISIIGILSSIVLVALKNAREKARIAAALNFSSQVKNAVGIGNVGEWSFDGNLNDTFSGFGNNGTWVGAGDPVYVDSADPSLGQAISFDGDHYIQISPSPSLVPPKDHAFTAEAWIKMDAYAPSGGGNMSAVICRSDHFSLEIRNTGTFTVRFWSAGSGDSAFFSSSQIKLGKWYHIAASFIPPDTIKFYLDGVEVFSESGILFKGPFSPGFYPDLYIGKGCVGFWSYNFVGTIDNVRIYYEPMP